MVKNLNVLFLLFIFLVGCREMTKEKNDLKLENIFQNPPLTIASVTQFYQSNISAEALNDMDESVLCVSTAINKESHTYFIQPDKLELKEFAFKYQDALIVDMKTGLLVKDNASGKMTLIYLPGRFPIDNMTLKPDVIIPVMGITRYHSRLEKISSRWTEIVCKCTDYGAGENIYKNRTIRDCDTGGTGISECSLTTDGSVTNCETQCRTGANACCWIEF